MKRSLLFLVLIGAGGSPPSATPVELPVAPGAIGFDDLRWAPVAGRVLVPAGRTGTLFLIDPAGGKPEAVGGFTSGPAGGRHNVGTTSVDEGKDALWVIDRGARSLSAVDAKSHKLVGSAALAAGPDYVRWVGPTSEVWVSEPHEKQIEVFTVAGGAPKAAAKIAFPDGPESLAIDAARGRAYSHAWGGQTFAVDLKQRKVVATWDNGCKGSRGIALDEARGFLFVGCEEGKAVVLDVAHDGKVLATSEPLVAGVDIIAYDAARSRLAVPGEESGTMAVFAVSAAGTLEKVAVIPTAKGAHCVTIDGGGGMWVCDPEHGRLLRVPPT